MAYLGTIYDKNEFAEKFTIRNNADELNIYPKPIAITQIDNASLEEILKMLNGNEYFRIEECNEIKLSVGMGINETTNYKTILGKITKTMESTGPYFRGQDGRTIGGFKVYKISPQTDIAIIVKENITSYYSEEQKNIVENKRGNIYILKKILINTK